MGENVGDHVGANVGTTVGNSVGMGVGSRVGATDCADAVGNINTASITRTSRIITNASLMRPL